MRSHSPHRETRVLLRVWEPAAGLARGHACDTRAVTWHLGWGPPTVGAPGRQAEQRRGQKTQHALLAAPPALLRHSWGNRAA